jgi:2-(1,2-epoxy-1,2-dihydrophenyl)acetyl-CoA isomerase
MTYELIEVERDGRVGIIRLNRPEKLNAWSEAMNGEQRTAIEEFNADDQIGAIVMTGNGRAFCAGADISGWADQLAGGERQAATAAFDEDWLSFCARSKPLIAAVNGYCIGVGATQILPFDIRVAGEDAEFSFRFVKMGLLPELASTAMLPRIIGLGNSLEICLTARMVDAESALRMGLVSQVAPKAELMDAALRIANEVASNPSPQLITMKGLFQRHAVATDISAVLEAEGQALAEAYKTPEHQEAVSAFMEKRTPRFYPD